MQIEGKFAGKNRRVQVCSMGKEEILGCAIPVKLFPDSLFDGRGHGASGLCYALMGGGVRSLAIVGCARDNSSS